MDPEPLIVAFESVKVPRLSNSRSRVSELLNVAVPPADRKNDPEPAAAPVVPIRPALQSNDPLGPLTVMKLVPVIGFESYNFV